MGILTAKRKNEKQIHVLLQYFFGFGFLFRPLSTYHLSHMLHNTPFLCDPSVVVLVFHRQYHTPTKTRFGIIRWDSENQAISQNSCPTNQDSVSRSNDKLCTVRLERNVINAAVENNKKIMSKGLKQQRISLFVKISSPLLYFVLIVDFIHPSWDGSHGRQSKTNFLFAARKAAWENMADGVKRGAFWTKYRLYLAIRFKLYIFFASYSTTRD